MIWILDLRHASGVADTGFPRRRRGGYHPQKGEGAPTYYFTIILQENKEN